MILQFDIKKYIFANLLHENRKGIEFFLLLLFGTINT